MNIAERHDHEFPPLVFEDSEVLILGSFPSVASRAQKFFYGHPMNRFWAVLAAIFHAEKPKTIEEKTALCKQHHIALYDVIDSCEIVGSSDASIKDVVFADILGICRQGKIRGIILNGKTAGREFEKYLKTINHELKVPSFVLPSTSPANAACSLDKLVAEWSKVLIDLTSLKD